MGSKIKIQRFEEYGQIAYQIKGNDKISNIQQYILKVVMLHINLKEIEHRATCKHALCPYVTHGPWCESSRVASQINWNGSKSTMQAHILSLHTASTALEWSKGQNRSHFAHQVKGNGA